MLYEVITLDVSPLVPAGDDDGAGELSFRPGDADLPGDVITSYSIHYTKLYDVHAWV